MTKIKLLIISTLSLLVFATSCKKDDNTTDSEKVNECLEYEATEASNIIQSTWSEANEIDDYIGEISIPNDAGGGYVKVTLSQGDSDLKPELIVDNELDVGAAIISGSSAQTNNTFNREAYFSVHPGQAYSIRVKPFFNASDYPVDYSIEWEFLSRVDCFEPNDVQSDAKEILLDETIEAYAISGHIDYSVGSFDENTYDWYKVTLDNPIQLVAEIDDLPSDMRIQMRFFKADENIVPIDFEWIGAETDLNRGRLSKITSSSLLAAGTYYIEVHSDFVLSRKQNSDLEILPEHFNKKYELSLSAL